MIEQWSFDKGTGRRAGMGTRGYTTQAEFVGEAGSATAVGQLLRRKGLAGQAHDNVVPVKAFQRDVVRKLRLRKVMGKPVGQQKEVLAKDKDALLPGQQFVKEQVNYRYSGDPARSCGACAHFVAPSSCEIVAGLINRVDLCDKFEPLHRGRGDGVVRAELIPNENTLGESRRRIREGRVVQAYTAEQWDGDDADYENGGDCADDEMDADGRCPSDPGFDDSTAGLFDPDLFGFEGEEEVTPPGFEPVVRALKKQPDVEEPYAVAWAMKKSGLKPKAAEGDGIAVGRIVRQSEGMSVMGSHTPISDVPSSPSGRYENPANRKAGGVLS